MLDACLTCDGCTVAVPRLYLRDLGELRISEETGGGDVNPVLPESKLSLRGI